MKWAGQVITTGQKRNSCVLVGYPAVVRTNTLLIQEYVGGNIALDLMDMVWTYGDADWINLSQKVTQWWTVTRR